MQLFFNFISFQKELAAYPLPSNLSAEPPPLAASDGSHITPVPIPALCSLPGRPSVLIPWTLVFPLLVFPSGIVCSL